MPTETHASASERAAEPLAAALRRCCGSWRWVELVLADAPFASPDALHAAADRAFERLEPGDWLDAFSHHPRIGDRAALRDPRSPHAATADLSSREQEAASSAAEEVLGALAAANARYERRFGFVFLVCATGKSAGEMLSLLRDRLGNERDRELEIAAAEQRKITHIRLERFFPRAADGGAAGVERERRGRAE
jgi:2-oxo-4-hydroxy-4-carboxy-5-ureidoimidazoline decarboxylase